MIENNNIIDFLDLIEIGIMKALGFLAQFNDIDQNIRKISEKFFTFEHSKPFSKRKTKVQTVDLNQLEKFTSSNRSLNPNFCMSMKNENYEKNEEGNFKLPPTRGNSPKGNDATEEFLEDEIEEYIYFFYFKIIYLYLFFIQKTFYIQNLISFYFLYFKISFNFCLVSFK